MALDASIILAGRAPQLDDPLTIRAKQATLADLMGRQQLTQLQMQGKQFEMEDAQRARQGQQALSDLYRTNVNPDGSVNRQGLTQGLASVGQGAQIPGLVKQFAEQDKAKNDNQAAQLKAAADRLKIVGGRLSSLLANPNITHDEVISNITGLVQDGVIDQAHGARLVQGLPGDPGRLRQALLSQGMQVMDESKRIELLLPKTEMRNLGGSDQAFSTNQLTGEVTPGQSFTKTATPGETLSSADRAAALAQQAKDAAAGRAVQIRGQDVQERTAAAGRIPSGYRMNKDGSMIAIPGGPADTKAGSAGQKVQDATEAIQLINQAEPLLKGSTGSYSGVAIDTLAQAFGIATPGAINAQQLKAIEGALVSKMPKMSGPQSDKDVALYRQMAAVIGDATIPYAQKAAALEQVREIQERYAGMPRGSSNTNRKVSGSVAAGAPTAAPSGGVVDWGSLK